MSMRILIVEDDEVLQSVLLRAAQSNHCYAEGVSSAESALERVRQEPFDMVITDVTLPGMSGLDLLPHLQQL